ncbi:MAG TPA: M43 family zinc metalloprotease [Flavobacteriales bacterium]|nr:M43 family zinc metalloprotease [Flavobacteriales bacterium]
MKIFPRVLPLAALAVLGTAGTLNAQNVHSCSTDEVRKAMIAENPDLLRLEAEYELGLREYLQAKAGEREDDTTVYLLPLVFHILYDPTQATDGHNVSDQRIRDEVAMLNINYSASNTGLANICCGFNSIIGNARIRFELATKDPFGNCTNGIERITSLRSTNAGNFAKLNPWPREHYINVWVINKFPPITGGGVLAGFSQFPADVQDGTGALRDGVIMISSSLTSGSNEGTTLTHELGHYLNLSHTWGNDNSPGISCGDDGVDDTPMTKGHNLSCAIPADLYDCTCNSTDLVNRYTFADVTTTSGTQDPTPAPALMYPPDTTGVPAAILSPFRANGVSGNSAMNGQFAFTDWGTGSEDGDSIQHFTGSLDAGRYYEFTVTPQLGYSMPITGITFKVDRSDDGPRSFAVRSSVNSFGSNLNASVSGSDTLVLAVTGGNTIHFRHDTSGLVATAKFNASYVNRVDPITFRIYAWNAEDANGYFRVSDVQLTGKYGKIENTQNYMDYSSCANEMFTKGQVERMRATLNMPVSGRSNLWSPENHVYTGVNGHQVNCAPQADFYTRTPLVCANSPVQFKANVKRATATSWQWTFDGGNPATSTQENPTVTFSEPGAHNVTLTVSNDQGSNTISKWDAVIVGGNYTDMANGLYEPFNNTNDFNRWVTQNLERNNSYWHWSNQTGHNGVGAAKLNASNTYNLTQDLFSTPTEYLHDVDNLITPSLALGFHNNITVSFWYAYSTQTSNTADVTETLKVYASSNCGETWLLRHTLSGAALVTGGVHSAGYVPTANEWREATFTLPSLFATPNVRLKFEYTSSPYSNDLFIDDLQINATNVGVAEVEQGGFLGLVPNPATNSVTVQMDLAGSSNGTLTFMDMTGRAVYEQSVQAGVDHVEVDLGRMGITSGMYLVRLKHDNGQRVERLVVR